MCKAKIPIRPASPAHSLELELELWNQINRTPPHPSPYNRCTIHPQLFFPFASNTSTSLGCSQEWLAGGNPTQPNPTQPNPTQPNPNKVWGIVVYYYWLYVEKERVAVFGSDRSTWLKVEFVNEKISPDKDCCWVTTADNVFWEPVPLA